MLHITLRSRHVSMCPHLQVIAFVVQSLRVDVIQWDFCSYTRNVLEVRFLSLKLSSRGQKKTTLFIFFFLTLHPLFFSFTALSQCSRNSSIQVSSSYFLLQSGSSVVVAFSSSFLSSRLNNWLPKS